MEGLQLMRKESVERLQELIRVVYDSAEGFQEAADVIKNAPELAEELRGLAQAHQAMADDLRAQVIYNKRLPPARGRTTGTLRRAWMDLKAALTGGEPKSALLELERLERKLKEKYEDALEALVGEPICELLIDHYERVADAYSQVARRRELEKTRAR